jgi:hypothetical protein
MCSNCSNKPQGPSEDDIIAICGAGFIVGGVIGGLVYAAEQLHQGVLYVLIGALVGAFIGFVRPTLMALWSRIESQKWKPTELNFGHSKLGTIKLVVDDAQRRAAMRIFAQMSTRILLRPMQDHVGDDGKAIKSVFDFLTFARDTVTNLDSPLKQDAESVETCVLEMINDKLAPFLESWHVRWDTWKEAQEAQGKPTVSKEWSEHDNFRKALRELQHSLKPLGATLAQAAGIHDPCARFPELL